MNRERKYGDTEPPDYLDGAKIIRWAWSGDQPFSLVGEEEIVGLAIGQFEGSDEIYRFSCKKSLESHQRRCL
jgi:hypothetical protein